MNYKVEPSAEIRVAAHGMREIYLALRDEGFSETEATRIIGIAIGTRAQIDEG